MKKQIQQITGFKGKLSSWLLSLLLIIPIVSGAQVKKTVTLPEFHSIVLNSDYRVTVRQSNTQEIKVEADSEIWEATKLWVDMGVLYIDVEEKADASKKNLLNKLESKLNSKMEIHITIKDLKKIQVNGNGSVAAENSITGNLLELEVNSSGKITVDSRATQVNVGVFDEGEVNLTGYSTQLNFTIAGGGKLNAQNFDAKKATGFVRGNDSLANISASETVSAEVFGSGKVFYRGNAKNINKIIRGKGAALYRN